MHQIPAELARVLDQRARDLTDWTETDRVTIAAIASDVGFLVATEAGGGKVSDASLDHVRAAAANVAPHAGVTGAAVLNQAVAAVVHRMGRRFSVPVPGAMAR
jgi:hypothetical protein